MANIPVWSTKWSSQEEAHRFTVYNPKDGQPYGIVQGCGAEVWMRAYARLTEPITGYGKSCRPMSAEAI